MSRPLPTPDGQSVHEVVVTERHHDADIDKLELTGSEIGKAWTPVYVYRIIDQSLIEGGTVREGALDLVYAWPSWRDEGNCCRRARRTTSDGVSAGWKSS